MKSISDGSAVSEAPEVLRYYIQYKIMRQDNWVHMCESNAGQTIVKNAIERKMNLNCMTRYVIDSYHTT